MEGYEVGMVGEGSGGGCVVVLEGREGSDDGGCEEFGGGLDEEGEV